MKIRTVQHEGMTLHADPDGRAGHFVHPGTDECYALGKDYAEGEAFIEKEEAAPAPPPAPPKDEKWPEEQQAQQAQLSGAASQIAETEKVPVDDPGAGSSEGAEDEGLKPSHTVEYEDGNEVDVVAKTGKDEKVRYYRIVDGKLGPQVSTANATVKDFGA